MMDAPDVYRLDIVHDEASALSSAADFVAEEMLNDDDLIDLSREGFRSQGPADERPAPQAQGLRPPPISTDWGSDAGAGNSGGDAGPGDEADDAAVERESAEDARVAFNASSSGSNAANFAGTTEAATTMIHFRNPKRYHNNYASPYPTQSLRQGDDGAADPASERVAAEGGRPAKSRAAHGRAQRQRRGRAIQIPSEASDASLAEVTPAFLRRAAQNLGVASNGSAEAAAEPGARDAVPPNALMNRRHGSSTSSHNIMNSSIPDSSFYGADASALDGTFVSIRDLNDDDDVPSVDNDRWNSTTGKGAGDGAFPTETTSLLGRNVMMPWQGGFFGSQMEKEDRRERRRMRLRNRRGWLPRWVWTARTMLSRGKGKPRADGTRGAGARWETSHPIGGGFASPASARHSGEGSARRRAFSLFLTGALCFHMALCGIHDLFLRYLSYRNPEYGGEAEVSWNGEGKYLPPYWVSFDGRVLNPLIGPCARTLTMAGALVPGIVLSRGQVWRVGTSLFETSSLSQLMLHIWALRTAVGGSLTGLEWKRDTATTVLLYFISALIGSTWSIALEPGRLVTTSGLGISGLLAAAIVEQACFPLASKEDEDEAGTGGHLNDKGNVSNGISSSTNEQFTYQPPNSQKKRKRSVLTVGSPTFILLLEALSSWLAAYSSLVGTVMAAVAGAACALLLFVGCPPHGCIDENENRDLILSEEPPPPPPPKLAGGGWRDDDDSADTSIGASRQYNTPLMRRSILADDDDEEDLLGTRSTLRRRFTNNTSLNAELKGRMISIKGQKPFPASRIIALVIGVLLKLLLTLVPASLIAGGDGPSNEVTRASALGCRPMRILYKEDGEGDQFECAGGCIPLSRERVARWSEGMRAGRCDSIGYRCWQQSATMTLRNYEMNVGIYSVPSADGTCATATDDDGEGKRSNNDDAVNAEALDSYNGEVEGAQ